MGSTFDARRAAALVAFLALLPGCAGAPGRLDPYLGSLPRLLPTRVGGLTLTKIVPWTPERLARAGAKAGADLVEAVTAVYERCPHKAVEVEVQNCPSAASAEAAFLGRAGPAGERPGDNAVAIGERIVAGRVVGKRAVVEHPWTGRCEIVWTHGSLVFVLEGVEFAVTFRDRGGSRESCPEDCGARMETRRGVGCGLPKGAVVRERTPTRGTASCRAFALQLEALLPF